MKTHYVRAWFSVCAGLAAIQPAAADADGELRSKPERSPARGIVRGVEQIAFTSDLQMPVKRIGFRDGEEFKSGDLLISFDCRRPLAELKAANANLREARRVLETSTRLERMMAGSRNDTEIAHAHVDKAEAEAEVQKLRLEHCDIAAPFSGRVNELSINAFETPVPGKPFLAVVNRERLEVELVVPSAILRELKAGQRVIFTIDETAKSYDMTISRTGASVDPVSQMIKVFATFDATPGDVLAGMSGTAAFSGGDN